METKASGSDTTNTPFDSRKEHAKGVVDVLREHGQLWARLGLSLGRTALENNARTLHTLAETLGKLADSLKSGPPEEPEPPRTEV